jgi:hypothetical protein
MPERTNKTGWEAKVHGRTASRHVSEETDRVLVPVSPSTKDGTPSAERGEGTRGPGTGSRAPPSRTAAHAGGVHRLNPPAHGRPAPGQRRCAEEARRPRGDGATWQAYEPGLDERLSALPGRVYRRTYRAQPARRGYVPQPEGRQRLLGIAVLEDKRGQQAVVTICNQMYEEDVRGGSSGVRPGRRPHRALAALSGALTRKRVNDGLEYDSRGCCAPLSQAWLVKLLQHRVAAPRILRLRQKGLRASVSEEGQGSEMLVGGP